MTNQITKPFIRLIYGSGDYDSSRNIVAIIWTQRGFIPKGTIFSKIIIGWYRDNA